MTAKIILFPTAEQRYQRRMLKALFDRKPDRAAAIRRALDKQAGRPAPGMFSGTGS